MIFSAIAGWFVKRFWPTGILVVLLISSANAIIQYFRYEGINSNRGLLGEGLLANGTAVVLGGFAIDVVINLVIFAIVWGLRRKLKPHLDDRDTTTHRNDEDHAPNR